MIVSAKTLTTTDWESAHGRQTHAAKRRRHTIADCRMAGRPVGRTVRRRLRRAKATAETCCIAYLSNCAFSRAYLMHTCAHTCAFDQVRPVCLRVRLHVSNM